MPTTSSRPPVRLRSRGEPGDFEDAVGSAKFTAVFDVIYPASSFAGGTSAPLQLTAFYSVEGTVNLPEER